MYNAAVIRCTNENRHSSQTVSPAELGWEADIEKTLLAQSFPDATALAPDYILI